MDPLYITVEGWFRKTKHDGRGKNRRIMMGRDAGQKGQAQLYMKRSDVARVLQTCTNAPEKKKRPTGNAPREGARRSGFGTQKKTNNPGGRIRLGEKNRFWIERNKRNARKDERS